jgi:hypothetical protein
MQKYNRIEEKVLNILCDFKDVFSLPLHVFQISSRGTDFISGSQKLEIEHNVLWKNLS